MDYLRKATAIIALFYISTTLSERPSEKETITWTGNLKISRRDRSNQNFDTAFAGTDHHAFALLNCTDYSKSHLEKCSLTIVRHYFDNHTDVKVCNLKPLEEGNIVKVKELSFLQNDKVLIAWEGKHIADIRSNLGWQRSVQYISTDSCEQGNYLKIRGNGRDDNNDSYFFIPSEKRFDVVYENKDECGSFSKYCKLKFLDGDTAGTRRAFPELYISKPSKFAQISGVHRMGNRGAEEFVIIGKTDENEYESGIVYSPITDYTKLEYYSEGLYSYSNTSGFSTLCWRERPDGLNTVRKVDTKLSCKWLDGTHEHDTFVADDYFYKNIPAIINTPEGNILITAFGGSGKNAQIIIEEARSDNKCKRLRKFDWLGKVTRSFKVSRANDGRLCISSVHAYENYDKNTAEPRYNYQFSTKCVDLQNNENFGICGKRAE